MDLRSVRFGLVLALVAIAFAFTLGALFGAAEESLKGTLKASGEAALATKYGGDAAKLKSVLDKSWVYFQRAHLHGAGLGAVALGLCLVLASLQGASSRLRSVAAVASGFGAIGYAVFWLAAGFVAPGAGGTSAAKQSLEWLAIPASGLAIVGLLLSALLVAKALFGRPPAGGPAA